MKKHSILAALFMVTAISFGQKKELKKAEKALASGDITEAMSQLDMAESMMSGADTNQQVQFYTLKGEVQSQKAGDDIDKLKMAADAFLKAKELSGDSDSRVEEGIQNLRVNLVNSAIKDQNTKNFDRAAKKLYTSYTISKKDTSDLYYAAGNALNNKDFDSALKYYEILNDLGYSGIKTELVATNKISGEVEVFNSEVERNLMLKSGEFIKPEARVTSSDRGEILRNMTLIYLEQGNEEKAKALMKVARSENPDDPSLVRAEADMAYKMGDMVNYKRLIKEVVALDPENPELYFNLGVSSAELKEFEEAMTYYEKALELDDTYNKARINIATLILKDETAIVDEMNNLGTSRADNQRYDVLKEQRNNVYHKALPYLETVVNAGTDKIEILRTLMNIYSQTGEDVKYKEMKAIVQQMEGGQ
ncbi:tetratricopeptide repeat protein [Ulvibacter antarcticus]|uniref:Tetratricopeptide repeat protein n=1 Tax=Ulvibacter antarcticus TaxID=442714 RepID=A0A3L9YWR2_9FLAO|nr:tetratricopeptide repeat protein [Ulvibacter antarcticus]RMA64220.1 tetratricopeptide repeat protein [Ulvibacter antarcticus]